MRLTVDLPRRVSDEVVFAVEDQGVYAAPAIRKVRVVNDGATLEVECDDSASEATMRRAVSEYVRDFVGRFRAVTGQVLSEHQRRDKGPIITDVYRGLCDRGWVIQLGRGQVGYSGPALKLREALDRAWTETAVRRFAAVEQAYPTLIPTDVLHRCGYFAAFPHLVTLVSHFVEDYAALKDIRDANARSGAMSIPRDDVIAAPEACVTPATCYHCYQGLSGKMLAAPGLAFTAVGRCCRYESGNMTGLDRLWELCMREWIFVGSEAWVTTQREAAMDAMRELIAAWDIECRIETANDPFFAPMYATKSFWQSQAGLKYETRLTVEPGADGTPRSLSACSFNLHETFFGDAFDISLDSGEPVWTGCVGIGVDRWVLACFTQHGFEPERWPDSLRAAVFG